MQVHLFCPDRRAAFDEITSAPTASNKQALSLVPTIGHAFLTFAYPVPTFGRPVLTTRTSGLGIFYFLIETSVSFIIMRIYCVHNKYTNKDTVQ